MIERKVRLIRGCFKDLWRQANYARQCKEKRFNGYHLRLLAETAM